MRCFGVGHFHLNVPFFTSPARQWKCIWGAWRALPIPVVLQKKSRAQPSELLHLCVSRWMLRWRFLQRETGSVVGSILDQE
eukprot:scaffold154568_cov18-Tisochrysis_lutea.AAC.1